MIASCGAAPAVPAPAPSAPTAGSDPGAFDATLAAVSGTGQGRHTGSGAHGAGADGNAASRGTGGSAGHASAAAAAAGTTSAEAGTGQSPVEAGDGAASKGRPATHQQVGVSVADLLRAAAVALAGGSDGTASGSGTASGKGHGAGHGTGSDAADPTSAAGAAATSLVATSVVATVLTGAAAGSHATGTGAVPASAQGATGKDAAKGAAVKGAAVDGAAVKGAAVDGAAAKGAAQNGATAPAAGLAATGTTTAPATGAKGAGAAQVPAPGADPKAAAGSPGANAQAGSAAATAAAVLGVPVTDPAKAGSPAERDHASVARVDAGQVPTQRTSGAEQALTPTLPVTGSTPTAPAMTATPVHQAAMAEPPALSAQLGLRLGALRTAPLGEHVLTMRVEPDSIGPVRVVAHIASDGVRIELLGANDQARHALRAALPDLRRDLAATGMSAELDLGDLPRGGAGQGQHSGASTGEPLLTVPRPVAASSPTVRTGRTTSGLDLEI